MTSGRARARVVNDGIRGLAQDETRRIVCECGDAHRHDGMWEVTIASPAIDGTVHRVLNAVSSALADEPAAAAVVLLEGREYRLGSR